MAMSDDPSPSRTPRGDGAGNDHSSATIGGQIRAWLKALTGLGEGDLRESLKEAIEERGGSDGTLDADQRGMLYNILSVGEQQVDDVMVPRADIVSVSVDCTLEQLIETLRQARHSRLPVYRENLDDIVGFLHIKDVLDFWQQPGGFTLQKILREPLAVPPSMLVLELLARMRTTRIHMAVVVDEYGGVDGLVTIEDVVEAIVGDIADEHDDDEVPNMLDNADGSIEADARVEIEEFEARYGIDLVPDEADEDIDTLGGFIVAALGHLPRRGETVRHASGFEFEVVEADPRRIKKLKVRRPAVEPADVAD
jgi:CBS domain containing-hemolysin-like protein